MSRLYYEDQQVAGLRMEEISQRKTGNYFEKVASLVPAEVLAGYMAMVGFLDKEEGSQIVERQGLLTGIFIFCLILTPVYLNFQAEKNRPKIMHLILSSIAFVVWTYVISGEKFSGLTYDAEIASVILIAFSLISGLVPLQR